MKRRHVVPSILLLVCAQSRISSAGPVTIQVTQDGQPIPGVAVTLTTPEPRLIETWTDGAGVAYFQDNHPPGIYTFEILPADADDVERQVEIGAEPYEYVLDYKTFEPTAEQLVALDAQLELLAEQSALALADMMFPLGYPVCTWDPNDVCDGVPDLGCGCGAPAPNECGCSGQSDLGCGCGGPAPDPYYGCEPAPSCGGTCWASDGPGYYTEQLGCVSCYQLVSGCYAYPLPECGCALQVCGS